MTNQNDILKQLKEILLAILGNEYDDSINALGEYEFIKNGQVIGTAPAIFIGFPLDNNNQPLGRMKANSGIKCTIDSAPMSDYHKQGNRLIRTHHTYGIYLDQYNPNKTLLEALDALVRMPNLKFKGDPIVIPVKIDPDKGFIPSRAILYVERITVLSSYY